MLPTSILMLNSQFILTPGKHSSKWVPNENRKKKMNSQLKVTLSEQSLKCGTKWKLHGYVVSHLWGRGKKWSFENPHQILELPYVKMELVTMKNDTCDLGSDTCKEKKFRPCTYSLEKTYHENYCHEILKTHMSRFDTMNWAKSIPYIPTSKTCVRLDCKLVM